MISTQIELITPKIADQILERTESAIAKGDFNPVRGVSDIKVDQYARDMVNGYWMTTHQGIGLDDDGYVLDGRHRLHAIKKSGVSIKIMVTRGIVNDPGGRGAMKVVDAMDRGRPRSLAQQLHSAHGVQNASLVASSCRAIAIALTGWGHTSTSVGQTLEILKFYEKEFTHIFSYPKAHATPTGAMAMYMHSFRKSGAEFVRGYCTLEGLTAGDPRLVLHRRFHGARGVVSKGLLNKVMSCASALHAWHEDRKLDSIYGSKQSLEWLISTCKCESLQKMLK